MSSNTTGNVYASPKVTLVVTGASRGFGASLVQAFVEEYCRQFAGDECGGQLRLVLIARNGEQLKTVASKLESMIDRDRLEVKLIQCDLAKPFDEVNLVPSAMLANSEHYLLVHNVGQVGHSNLLCTGVTSDQRSYRDEQFHLNLYSMMELTAGILKNLRELATSNDIKRLDVINISSLAAIQPFPGMLDYCVLKRAREAYIEQLAKEFEDTEHKLPARVRILNYAPGPLETDMLQEILDKGYLQKEFAKITALKPIDSARKLMIILKKDTFKNAQHIDYYDVEEN